MSPARIEIEWQQIEGLDAFTPAVEWLSAAKEKPMLQPLVRQVAGKVKNVRCPHCDSIIYSRKHKLCGVCGNELPSGVLFSPSEAQRVDLLLQSERKRHKEWMNKSFLQAVSIPWSQC